jgi:hypothetical protein
MQPRLQTKVKILKFLSSTLLIQFTTKKHSTWQSVFNQDKHDINVLKFFIFKTLGFFYIFI